MRYWWVNQNQTYRHEIEGGYLWSPKRKSNEQRIVRCVASRWQQSLIAFATAGRSARIL
jgi:hypothetical protein